MWFMNPQCFRTLMFSLTILILLPKKNTGLMICLIIITLQKLIQLITNQFPSRKILSHITQFLTDDLMIIHLTPIPILRKFI